MTKKELLEAIKDMPEDAQIMVRYKDWSDGGKLCIYNLRVENHIYKPDWRDKGTIIIDEI